MCVQERHLADSGAMSPPIAFCAVSIRICVVSKVVLHFPVYYYIDLKNLKTKKTKSFSKLPNRLRFLMPYKNPNRNSKSPTNWTNLDLLTHDSLYKESLIVALMFQQQQQQLQL